MKNTIKKTKTKTMYAVVQLIANREDLEDSTVEIIKVFKTKKAADKGLVKARDEFLLNVSDDIDEAYIMIDDDCDRLYKWSVKQVKVEV